jgi:hypothetical protein
LWKRLTIFPFQGSRELKGGKLTSAHGPRSAAPSNSRSVEQTGRSHAKGRGRRESEVEGDQQANNDRPEFVKGERMPHSIPKGSRPRRKLPESRRSKWHNHSEGKRTKRVRPFISPRRETVSLGGLEATIGDMILGPWAHRSTSTLRKRPLATGGR